jgi:Flp pilus assembly pilin Flp
MNTSTRRISRLTGLGNIGGPRGLIGGLLEDESGQDIVEYALLGAVVGIAAIVIWQQLATTVGEVYGATVAPAGQVQSLSSCMPGPDGTGC